MEIITAANKIMNAILAIGITIMFVKTDKAENFSKDNAIIGIIPILAESDNDSDEANCSNKNFEKNLLNTGNNSRIPSTAINESWKPAVNKSSGENSRIIIAASDNADKPS